MKIHDFEDAIAALGCSVVLDEVKLSKGHVRRFFGHRDNMLIMWDENGRGFSCVRCTTEEAETKSASHEGVTERRYDRDKMYDLKFE